MKGFYWYFRPIAFGFKILGIFPLDNVLNLDTSKIKFRLWSSSHLYSFSILSSFCVMIYYFCGFIFTKKSFAEVIKSYVIYGMIGRSVACFLVYGFKNYYELPKLIQLLDSFDRQKKKVLIQNFCFWRKLVTWTIMPSVTIVVVLIVSLKLSSEVIASILPPEIKLARYGTLSGYIFAYLMSRELYSSLLYIYFVQAINNGYGEINKTLTDNDIVPSYYKNVKYPSDMYTILSKLHTLHNTLAECVTQLSKVFGSFMAIDQFGVVVVLVINISVVLSLHAHFFHLLLLTIVNALLVAWVIFVSHDVKKNVSSFSKLSLKMWSIVQLLKLSKWKRVTRFEKCKKSERLSVVLKILYTATCTFKIRGLILAIVE